MVENRPMNRVLTKYYLDALKPADSRYVVWDARALGLGIRVSKNGTKSWVYVYRFEGRQQRLTFGEYPDLKISQARSRAGEVRGQLSLGIDPAEELRFVRASRRTVRELKDAFLRQETNDEVKERSARTNRGYKQVLKKYLPDSFLNRPVVSVRREDIVKLLNDTMAGRALTEKDRERTASTGRRALRNNLRRVMSSMFSFAVYEGWAHSNPVSKVRVVPGERPRTTVLDQLEIHAVWHGLDKAPMTASTKIGLKLMLVTGQRAVDLRRAEWSEIDLLKQLWHQPDSKTKNKKANDLPLSDLAVELLRVLRHITAGSSYLLPSPTDVSKPITENAFGRAVARARDTIPVEKHWTPHDLRRTMTTCVAGLPPDGTPDEVVRLILNHADDGRSALRHYNHAKRTKGKTKALQSWADTLRLILDGKEVQFV